MKINSCIAKALKDIDSDQAALVLEAFNIQDYFFDEAREEEDPDPPSKIDNKRWIQKLWIIDDEYEYNDYDGSCYPEVRAIITDNIIEDDSADIEGKNSQVVKKYYPYSLEHFNGGNNLLIEKEEEVTQVGTIHDVVEEEVAANVTQTSCRCTLYFGGPCNRAFSIEHLTSIRNQCQNLDRPSLDFVFLRQIMATNS